MDQYFLDDCLALTIKQKRYSWFFKKQIFLFTSQKTIMWYYHDNEDDDNDANYADGHFQVVGQFKTSTVKGPKIHSDGSFRV